MTEEVINSEVTDEVVDNENNSNNQTEQKFSEIEQRALEMGWRPKSEFSGDEIDFVDAKEFVSRKPLFDRIEHQSKELKEVRKALKALGDHHQKVKESEFKAAVEYLREEKRRALENGDADKLIEIDEKIAEAKAQQVSNERESQQQSAQPHPDFIAWVRDNTWYVADNELRVTADQIGTAYAASNPDKDPQEVLKYVKQRVTKLYPDKFKNPNKDRLSSVEGSSNTPARSTSPRDNFDLSEDERKVMNTFVRQGVMTKEEYIKELKRVKGVQ